MRRPLILSAALHLTVLLLAAVGLPTSPPVPPEDALPINVDIVTVGDVTTGTRAEPQPEAIPKPPTLPRPRVEAAPDPRPKATQRTEPPTPEPVPLPSPPAPAPPQRPAAEPVAAPTPDPAPKAAPANPPRTEIAEAPPAPTKKPAPPPTPKPPAPAQTGGDFASVLKTVEDLKRRETASRPPATAQRPEPKRAATDETDDSFDAQIARALAAQAGRDETSSLPMTVSEIEAVRRQIERCWNVPAGARDAENLVVKVRVEMNADGTPRTAAIVDDGRVRSDSFFRAAAESALRAVLNPRCHPFKLPADKFDRWKSMTLVFNPRDMLGT